MKLKNLKPNDEMIVLGYEDNGDFIYREKLLSMGITRGTKIKFLKSAPLGDPLQIEVRGFSVSLRKEEADILIIGDIEKNGSILNEVKPRHGKRDGTGRCLRANRKEHVSKERSDFTIALAGNPNCGKTTIFNSLTGSKQKVGNWPGVTVERLSGMFNFNNKRIEVVDLPGIYSFSAHSEDEKVSRDYLLSGDADLVVNIIDSSNLDRNLYLTTQLLEMNVPMILVFSMKDSALAKNMKVDVEKLSRLYDLPSIYISATNSIDLEDLKGFIFDFVKSPKISNVEVSYDNEIEDVIDRVSPKIESVATYFGATERWVVLKIIEGDDEVLKKVLSSNDISMDNIKSEISKIESTLNDEAELIVADTKYGFISGIVKSSVNYGVSKRQITEIIDKFVLNKFIGIPIFLVMMYFVFWMAISFGGAFIDFFDILFGTIFVDGTTAILTSIGAPDLLIAVLATGIGGGIQTIGTFIPIIFMLFFMTALLEDSGYMSRAAFVVDRFMRFIGLPGKAFIPLILGFGCTVPAIMATRTLENKRDRFLTIFMAPFMSCGARMSVYALFAAAFFPKNGQNIVFLIYLIGIVLAVITGFLLKKTLFRGESAPFVMELPVYHTPRIRHIFLHTWARLKGFVIDAGKVLMIIITVLSLLNSLGTDGSFNNENSEQSVLSYIGKTVTPIFSPFGVEKDNWPASVGLVTGLFAKEVIVGTLNSLYSQEAHNSPVNSKKDNKFSIVDGVIKAFISIPTNLKGLVNLSSLEDTLGIGVDYSKNEDRAVEELGVKGDLFSIMRSKFSHGPLQAFAYLLFVLLYVPCLVAVSATYREVGIKLTIFQVYYSTMLAWVIATLFYQITVNHDIFWIIFALALGSISISGIFVYANIKGKKTIGVNYGNKRN